MDSISLEGNRTDVDVDWQLIGVMPTVDDEPFDPFVYTNGLWLDHRLPELWVSSLGLCGHRVDVRGVAMVLNRLGQEQVGGEPLSGREYTVDFGTGVLRFHPRRPSREERERLQTYQTSPDAPVIEITWRCCARNN